MKILKENTEAGCWWLTSIIPATWKAEIRRIKVQSQLGKTVLKTPHLQNNESKMYWRCGLSSRVPAW
jgi:hypothetical protein